MNKNIVVVLGGAVLAAVLVAVLVQVTLGEKDSSVPISVSKGVDVLVAAQDLRRGTELESGDLEWKEWSESALFKGLILRKGEEKADDVLKGRLERSFSQGEAVVRSALLSGEGNDVVARLAPGERAVSIKVDAASMVAGFIAPGMYVDVILTYKLRMNVENSDDNPDISEMLERNLDKMATETILENVRVLAVDQKAKLGGGSSAKVGKTVTLAVSIREAEKLALASEMGEVVLAMRGVGDELANSKSSGITDARMISVDDEIFDAYGRIRENSDRHTGKIRIYEGNQLRSSSSSSEKKKTYESMEE